MKKMIIVLLIGVIVLGTVFIVVLMRKPQTNDNLETQTNPTGIVIPTKEIQNNELDIVKIDPIDNEINVDTNKKITITFSRNFTMDDIVFNMSPDTTHTTSIENNKLIIAPNSEWAGGTTYSFSVNFIDDVQKVRLYSFTTKGAAQDYLPDTEPEGSYENLLNDQKQNNPEVYVVNNTPYENGLFLITSAYQSQSPAHFYFTVTGKTSDAERVRQEVNLWLQTLDLSQDQINSLDIRYQQ